MSTRERGVKKERERISHLLIHKMATVARAGTDWSQEFNLSLPCGYKGPKNLHHFLLLSQGHWQGARSEAEHSEFEPASTWDAVVSCKQQFYPLSQGTGPKKFFCHFQKVPKNPKKLDVPLSHFLHKAWLTLVPSWMPFLCFIPYLSSILLFPPAWRWYFGQNAW